MSRKRWPVLSQMDDESLKQNPTRFLPKATALLILFLEHAQELVTQIFKARASPGLASDWMNPG